MTGKAGSSERSVELALKRIAGAHGVLPLKFVSPGFTGVPDRLLLAQGGRAAFAELKRPSGGRLSTIQIRVHAVLRSLGFRVAVITHPDGADTFFKEWLL